MDPTTRKFVQLLQAPDPDLRAAALRVVAELDAGGQAVVQAVGKCLREPREDLQILALKALHRLGAGEAAHLVVPLIAQNGVLGEHAMAIVTAIGPKAVPELVKLYGDSSEVATRRAVATALAETGGKTALQFLVERLPKESGDLQRHLISNLCDALDRTAPPQQAAVFPQVTGLLRSSAEQTRIGAVNVLGHFRDPATALKARAALRRFADRKHSLELRRYALLSYQRLLEAGRLVPEDLKFLREMLCDSDWQNIAHHALASLEKLDVSKREVAFLNDLLRSSPHFPVRSHVLRILGNVDRPEIAESVIPFLADSDLSVRERAEETLRAIPSAAPLLLDLLRDSEDIEVAQRSFAVLRDMPLDVRKRWLERAVDSMVDCFDRSLERYQFFLEFVRGVDPEPLRKRIYRLARSLKTGRSRERWQRMAAYLRLLWDHHLITPEGRYLLALALLKLGTQEISPAARKEDLGLQVIRALIYDDQDHLIRSLRRDRDLKPEDYFYLGFHFVEEGEATRGFGVAMLEHVLRTAPAKSRTRAAALHKLESLQVAVAEPPKKASRRKSKKADPSADVATETTAESAAAPTRRAPARRSSPASADPAPSRPAAAAASPPRPRGTRSESPRTAPKSASPAKSASAASSTKASKTAKSSKPAKAAKAPKPSKTVKASRGKRRASTSKAKKSPSGPAASSDDSGRARSKRRANSGSKSPSRRSAATGKGSGAKPRGGKSDSSSGRRASASRERAEDENAGRGTKGKRRGKQGARKGRAGKS